MAEDAKVGPAVTAVWRAARKAAGLVAGEVGMMVVLTAEHWVAERVAAWEVRTAAVLVAVWQEAGAEGKRAAWRVVTGSRVAVTVVAVTAVAKGAVREATAVTAAGKAAAVMAVVVAARMVALLVGTMEAL